VSQAKPQPNAATLTGIMQQVAVAEVTLAKATALPQMLLDEAPDAYVRRLLEEVGQAFTELEIARRALIEEAMRTKSVTHKQIQQATGVGLTTLQRWGKAWE
jgi:hypothetical protein